MATSQQYRNGPIYSLVPNSGESLGTGGQLLNNNFTELYDMVQPEYSTSNELADVAALTYSGSRKVTTFALPVTSGLNPSTSYVATYKAGYVDWTEYAPTNNSGNGSGSTVVVATGDVSELTNPSNSAAYNYTYSGTWHAFTQTMPKYQKTYKAAKDGRSLEINIPAFGPWLITGTVFASIYDKDTYSSTSNGALCRVDICGSDASIGCFFLETRSGSGTSWNSTNLIYDNNNTLWSYSGPSNNKVTLIFDPNTTVNSNNITLVYDLTVAGGVGAPLGYCLDFVTSLTSPSSEYGSGSYYCSPSGCGAS